jgi:predicted nicotinamide N-methyase
LDSSVIQGPLSVAPCQTLISRFATFSSLYGVGRGEHSVLLARWIVRHAELFQGKSVLELGSGLGLAGEREERKSAPACVQSKPPEVLN